MKIVIQNEDAIKKVYINGVDFDSMTLEYQLEQLVSILNKDELKTALLSILNERDFSITKSQNENGSVIELNKK